MLFPIRGEGNRIIAIVGIYDDNTEKENLLKNDEVSINVLNSFKNILEIKDKDTNSHTVRVEKYAKKIGKKLKFNEDMMKELSLCAKLHDIGKIAMPDHILTKPDKLTQEEYEIMKSHTEKGYRILNSLGEDGMIAKSVLTHHERWDGNGYPLKLKQEDIPLYSRIIAIADSYDAMVHERVYKKAMKKEDAIEELKKCSNRQFDSKLVNTFIHCIK